MSKVMLVEDDNNLREIYEARLIAEGYEIVSAADGEAALALAIKEKPDLIISDIMMPKVSGFDMLDILKSTTETKDIKIIMMTALSQAEDKTRAENLGANIYLVKSQVTLEDVVKSVRDLLGQDTLSSVNGIPVQAPADANSVPTANTSQVVASAPAVTVPTKTSEQPSPNLPQSIIQPPVVSAVPAVPAVPNAPIVSGTNSTPQPNSPPVEQTVTPAPTPAPAPAIAQASVVPTETTTAETTPQVNSLTDADQSKILTKESADEIASATSTANEEALLQKQIEQFISDQPISPDPLPKPEPSEPEVKSKDSSASLPATTPLPPEPTPPAKTTAETPKELAEKPASTPPAETKVNSSPPPTNTPPPAETPPPPNNTTPPAETPPPTSNSIQPANLPVKSPDMPTQNLASPSTPQVVTPSPPPPKTTPSSMASPPSSLKTNTAPSGDPTEDRPAGEQILVKNANDDTSSALAGIDASISGRKKVIEPINDITKSSAGLADLIAKETTSEIGQPQLNSVITPEGITLASNNGLPTMNDVISPVPQPLKSQTQLVTEQPLPPPVA